MNPAVYSLLTWPGAPDGSLKAQSISGGKEGQNFGLHPPPTFSFYTPPSSRPISQSTTPPPSSSPPQILLSPPPSPSLGPNPTKPLRSADTEEHVGRRQRVRRARGQHDASVGPRAPGAWPLHEPSFPVYPPTSIKLLSGSSPTRGVKQ